MLIVALRALILYVLVVIVIRLMGKRQIGQMQAYELVITVIIAELAVVPMSDIGIPLVSGVVGILVLLASERFLSLLSLQEEKARAIICGTPAVLVDNGKPVPLAMQKARINMHELLQMLRSKECPNVCDVAYAILETNGTISVIPKADAKPATARDLGQTVSQPVLPLTLIMDGRVNTKNLQLAQVTLEELSRQAKERNILDLRDVFFAQITSQGQLDFHSKQGAI